MSALLYAIESWIMAVIGMAWLSIRTFYEFRSFIEEYLLYSQIVLATLHLVIASVTNDKNNICRAYFVINLTHWLLAVYCMVDSSYEFDTSIIQTNAENVPLFTNTSTACCPNTNISIWNRQIYFGGLQFFMIPMSITIAFQTIQVIIAAGGLLHTQTTLWPGVSLGYIIITFASIIMSLKYSGFFHPPCPDGTITILSGYITLQIYLVLWIFTTSFPIIAFADSLIQPAKARLIWNLLGAGVITLFTFTVYINMKGSNLITYPWCAFVATGFLPILYTFYDITKPHDLEIPLQHIREKIRNRTRFVMPIQTDTILQVDQRKNSKKD